jgi:hypothetical protein
LRFVVALLFVLFFSSPVYARLGASKKKCDNRYGKPEYIHNGSVSGIHTRYYYDGKYRLAAVIVKGKCQAVVFQRKSRKPMKKKDMRRLLEKNSNGQRWTQTVFSEFKNDRWEGNMKWMRTDGTVGFYRVDENSLVIQSEDFTDETYQKWMADIKS